MGRSIPGFFSLFSKEGPVGTADGSNQGWFKQEWVMPGYARQACHDGKVDRNSHGRQSITAELRVHISADPKRYANTK